jgi:hypothetical protein
MVADPAYRRLMVASRVCWEVLTALWHVLGAAPGRPGELLAGTAAVVALLLAAAVAARLSSRAPRRRPPVAAATSGAHVQISARGVAMSIPLLDGAVAVAYPLVARGGREGAGARG